MKIKVPDTITQLFYITTTGQKVIVIVPQLVHERNQLAMQRLQQNIGELQAMMSADPPHP